MNLIFGVGIGRELEGLDAMGLRCVCVPDTLNRATSEHAPGRAVSRDGAR